MSMRAFLTNIRLNFLIVKIVLISLNKIIILSYFNNFIFIRLVRDIFLYRIVSRLPNYLAWKTKEIASESLVMNNMTVNKIHTLLFCHKLSLLKRSWLKKPASKITTDARNRRKSSLVKIADHSFPHENMLLV